MGILPQMKHYIYRSQAKIDLLWEQLASKKKEKYAGELKFNLGIISGGIKSHSLDENLHARLEIVLQHLRHENQIGGLDKPAAFVEGVLPMKWQEADFGREQSDPRMVLFHGWYDHPEKLLALIGSASHVVGMSKLEPATLHYLQPSFWNEVVETFTPPDEGRMEYQAHNLSHEIRWREEHTFKQAPTQRLEFVAKTLSNRDRFLVASPLYVAEAPLL
jgi:hypothetical protein